MTRRFLVVAVLGALAAVSAARGQELPPDVKERLLRLEREVEALKRENARLREEVGRLKDAKARAARGEDEDGAEAEPDEDGAEAEAQPQPAGGVRPGQVYVYELNQGPGGPKMSLEMRVVGVRGAQVTYATKMLMDQGRGLEALSEEEKGEWTPEDSEVPDSAPVREETLEVPGGRIHCKVYEVGSRGDKSLTTLWIATEGDRPAFPFAVRTEDLQGRGMRLVEVRQP